MVTRGGQVELRLDGLHPDTHDLLATRGDIALSIDVASLEAPISGMRATGAGLTLTGNTALAGNSPFAVGLEAGASRLRVVGPDGKVMVDGPAHLKAQVRDVRPDASNPPASRGIAHAAVDLGEMHVSLEATKGADALDFAVRAAARSLKAVRPFLPSNLNDEVPWDQMALALRSSGHLEPLSGGVRMAVRQTTDVDVERPAFRNIAARSLSMTLKSQGTALHHQAEVDLHAPGLAWAGGRPSDDRLTLSATADRERTSFRFGLATEGHAAAKVSGSLSFDPARRAVLYETDAHLAGLAPVAPLAAKAPGIEALDLSQLTVDLSARGALLGVVAGVARDGAITLEPSPALTAATEGTADLRVGHFRWSRGDVAIATPALAWHGDMRARGPRRTLDSRLDVGTLHLDLGSHDVDAGGIRDEASVSIIGNLAEPEIELAQRLTLAAVEQDIVREYPLGDIAVSLSAERTPAGMVHVSDVKFENGLGGTAIAVTGNVDFGEGRRTLALTTSATQDLARLSTIPERFTGRGKLTVEATVTSPNLAFYEVRAAVKGKDVTVTLPSSGIAVESANGDVPITVVLESGANGFALKRSTNRSPYSMLRFADQHPLLTHSGFLSIASLTTPFVSIAPLVGNLAIDQNLVSLRQFEMGVRGGTITGQCGLDWDGPKSTLELHVRASGVRSSHGEPFDGNIAVTISAADRTIEGRAEILRIGERHLLDLLDMQDPLHVDPGMNRVRSALNFGYPKTLRLVFDHGFASAHLELGGLAQLVSIGELRGIPMGPIVDKMIASTFEGRETKEAP
jgi:hypothetical protein